MLKYNRFNCTNIITKPSFYLSLTTHTHTNTKLKLGLSGCSAELCGHADVTYLGLYQSLWRYNLILHIVRSDGCLIYNYTGLIFLNFVWISQNYSPNADRTVYIVSVEKASKFMLLLVLYVFTHIISIAILLDYTPSEFATMACDFIKMSSKIVWISLLFTKISLALLPIFVSFVVIKSEFEPTDKAFVETATEFMLMPIMFVEMTFELSVMVLMFVEIA